MLIAAQEARLKALENSVPFTDPVARQLVLAADAYIARRDSTGGKTILAGYPLFSDWGRDTMIAMPGCVLARNDFETAKSILRTFLAYEKDGLVPNLFPEGEAKPMYNTVDELTVDYEENGILKVKEVGKEVLSKGAWATVLFRYQEWQPETDTYGPDRYTIRRYKKMAGEYRQQS